ncbi:hypothetical protein KUCAC02_012549, partial [Chaenocephalus aceratus]
LSIILPFIFSPSILSPAWSSDQDDITAAVLCMSAWPSLSLTRRAERQMWCERGGEGEYRECGKHTDRSSQYSLLYEGQVHARRAEREKEEESQR